MAKSLTAEIRYVDVRQLVRDGLLVPGRLFELEWHFVRTGQRLAAARLEVGNDFVSFQYHASSTWQSSDILQTVRLIQTSCHYGGARHWFACPSCSRRVAILYLEFTVACRHCHQLAYKAQRETRHDRNIRRLEAIRERLGWHPGFLNGEEIKPKGMHWKTYSKLVREHRQLVLGIVGFVERRWGSL